MTNLVLSYLRAMKRRRIKTVMSNSSIEPLLPCLSTDVYLLLALEQLLIYTGSRLVKLNITLPMSSNPKSTTRRTASSRLKASQNVKDNIGYFARSSPDPPPSLATAVPRRTLRSSAKDQVSNQGMQNRFGL
jgi:hypothetical protein